MKDIVQSPADYEGVITGPIFVDADRGDDGNPGTIEQPVATITAGLVLVSATRMIVMVFPCVAGVYEEAAALVWPTRSGVKLMVLGGQFKTEIETVDGEDDIIHVAPGVQTASWEMWLENVYLDVSSGQVGLSLVHTGVGKKMLCYLENFGADCSSSGHCIKVTHGGSGNAVRIYMRGSMNGDVEGIIYHRFADAGDRLQVRDVRMVDGADIGTVAVTGELRLENCVVKHEGITGGASEHVLVCINSVSVTGSTFALVDNDDVVSVNWDTLIGA